MIKKSSFADFSLCKEVLKAITDLGYEEASPIQSQAIPVVMKGNDIIGQASTGSGKTAAFGIPLMEKIDTASRTVQAIVLCPTRELAIQVAGEMNKLGKYKLTIPALPIYGGQPIDRQIAALKRGPQIIIGTPGRIVDHINRKTLSLKTVTIAVLDEADEMLDMGFKDDIEIILQATPSTRQTLLFSATIPTGILRLTKTYQKNPITVKIVHEKLTAPDIEQACFEVESHRKLDLLSRLIDLHNPERCIVFCNTKRRVDEVINDLGTRGYCADGIHGDMTQQKRNKVMERFRSGDIDILVATDVAARGIDINNISIVFNFEIPQDEESYVHRIGRTGRAGKSGKAFSLVSGNEVYRFRDIKRYTRCDIPRLPIPSSKDVEAAKINKLFDSISILIKNGNLVNYTDSIKNMVTDECSILDIAAALLKIELGKK